MKPFFKQKKKETNKQTDAEKDFKKYLGSEFLEQLQEAELAAA